MGTRDYGRLYFTTVRLPRTPAPPVSRAISYETQRPWRTGYGLSFNRTWLVPLLFAWRWWWPAYFATWLVNRRWAKGYVIGWWGRPPADEGMAPGRRLMLALGGHGRAAPVEEVRTWHKDSSAA